MTEAEVKLAEMYVNAIGIPRNTQRGIALYESAARKGHVEARFFLATELAKGTLMAPDKKRAMSLMLTSAKQKHAGAQFALCVEMSTEDSKYYDAVEAYAWCEASSQKRHKQANEAVRRGTETLRKIQTKQGEEAVQTAKNLAIRYSKVY